MARMNRALIPAEAKAIQPFVLSGAEKPKFNLSIYGPLSLRSPPPKGEDWVVP